MPGLQWTIDHSVFVTEVDDQHQEIFQALSALTAVLLGGDPRETANALERLRDSLAGHFAHEERLMRAARYDGLRWHRERHRSALRRVAEFTQRIENGDREAPMDLVEYLTPWLDHHMRVADRMMGAALRNHSRAIWKVTITGGTKPLDACEWTTSRGERLQPPTRQNAL